MALFRYGGKILKVAGGLANDQNCCCDGDDIDCPDCCLNITSGALIDGEIKIFVDNVLVAMEVTITTPSGTRRVCQTDTIDINFVFTVPPQLEGVSPDAFAEWDIIWRQISIVPSTLGNNSSNNGYSHVYWGDDITDLSYTVSLKLNICQLQGDLGLGLITVGSKAWGIFADINIDPCAPSYLCCLELPVCEPCCYFLTTLGWAWNEATELYEQYFEADTYGVLFTLDRVVVCLDEFYRLTANIYPLDRDSAGDKYDILFGTDWPLAIDAGNDPIRGAGWTGTEGRWTDVDDGEYMLFIGPKCEGGFTFPHIATMSVRKHGEPTYAGGVEVQFTPCTGCDTCCCPRECCYDCYFPADDALCDQEPGSETIDDDGFAIGGKSQIEDFVFRQTFDVEQDFPPCEPYTVIEHNQREVSRHAFACTSICRTREVEGGDVAVECAQGGCLFVVLTTVTPRCSYVAPGPPVPDDDLAIWTLQYVGGGLWQATGPTGGIIMVEGDCTGGAFAATVGGVTTEIEFSVTRDLGEDAPACPEDEEMI
jgi:hypothetical protein